MMARENEEESEKKDIVKASSKSEEEGVLREDGADNPLKDSSTTESKSETKSNYKCDAGTTTSTPTSAEATSPPCPSLAVPPPSPPAVPTSPSLTVSMTTSPSTPALPESSLVSSKQSAVDSHYKETSENLRQPGDPPPFPPPITHRDKFSSSPEMSSILITSLIHLEHKLSPYNRLYHRSQKSREQQLSNNKGKTRKDEKEYDNNSKRYLKGVLWEYGNYLTKTLFSISTADVIEGRCCVKYDDAWALASDKISRVKRKSKEMESFNARMRAMSTVFRYSFVKREEDRKERAAFEVRRV